MQIKGQFLLILLCLTACTDTGPIKVGNDTYTISTRVPFGGPASAKGQALQEANVFCESNQREMLLSQVQSSECALHGGCGEAEIYFHCLTPNELVEQQKAHKEAQKKAAIAQLKTDNDKCISYGFKKGTDKFASCMMQMDLSRKQEEQNNNAISAQQQFTDQQIQAQRTAAAAAILGNIQQPVPSKPYPMPNSRPIQTNCYGAGNSINCTSQQTGVDTSMYPGGR